MALVRKETAGSVSGGYTWDRPGAIVDVPDELAAELIRQPDSGFSTVPYGHATENVRVSDGHRVLRAGATTGSDEGPELLDATAPAERLPIPAGWAAPGGTAPETVDVSANEAEPDDAGESERPHVKAAKARARKHVSE